MTPTGVPLSPQAARLEQQVRTYGRNSAEVCQRLSSMTLVGCLPHRRVQVILKLVWKDRQQQQQLQTVVRKMSYCERNYGYKLS